MYSEPNFWCPCCHSSALEGLPEKKICPTCRGEFPIVNGIPVLINDSNSVFAVTDYVSHKNYAGASHGTSEDPTKGLRSVYRYCTRKISEWGVETSSVNAVDAINIVRKHIETPRILVIGSGVCRYEGVGDFVYTDVAFSSGINAICDAHDPMFPRMALGGQISANSMSRNWIGSISGLPGALILLRLELKPQRV